MGQRIRASGSPQRGLATFGPSAHEGFGASLWVSTAQSTSFAVDIMKFQVYGRPGLAALSRQRTIPVFASISHCSFYSIVFQTALSTHSTARRKPAKPRRAPSPCRTSRGTAGASHYLPLPSSPSLATRPSWSTPPPPTLCCHSAPQSSRAMRGPPPHAWLAYPTTRVFPTSAPAAIG